MDIVEKMCEESAYWLALAQESFEEGEFSVNEENITLEQVEEEIQGRLDQLTTLHDQHVESVTWNEWLECYTALAQVKQAQAMERQAAALEHIEGLLRNGIPIEMPGRL